MAATQQELYFVDDGDQLASGAPVQPFAPVIILNHRYYLERYPRYYFVVRKDVGCNEVENERVCLYQEGVVCRHLAGDEKPFTMWVSNERREGRKLVTVYRDMEEKVKDMQVVVKR